MAQLDVLIVTPPSRLEVYQSLSNDLAAIEPPVWSGLIAEFLRNRSVNVAILDAEAEGLNHEQTAAKIKDSNPQLVLLMIYGQQPSASTQCMPAASKTARILRQLAGESLPILALGTHPSALPKRTLEEEPFTYVCQGEGPYTVLALIEAIKAGNKDLSGVPGLWYRDEAGTIRSTKPAALITDLDHELPRQALDLLDMSKYRAHNWHCFDDLETRGSYASLQTSLGCPFRCSFCCINAPFGENKIRYWTPENVIQQIDELVLKYNVRNIKVPDEMFVLSPRQVMGICDKIIERGYKLNFWAYARVDTLNDEVMLDKLKAAGFNWLALGIESASKYVRDGVTKGRFGNTDIAAVVQRVRDRGIYVLANYIFGLPDDTVESMTETLDFAMSLNTEWANFYCAMAYPGSQLYTRAVEHNIALPGVGGGDSWIGYSQHGYDCLPLPTDTLPATTVLDFRDQAFTKYFTNPAYLEMVEKTFGAKAREHVQEMTAHTLRRRHRDQQA